MPVFGELNPHLEPDKSVAERGTLLKGSENKLEKTKKGNSHIVCGDRGIAYVVSELKNFPTYHCVHLSFSAILTSKMASVSFRTSSPWRKTFIDFTSKRRRNVSYVSR